MRIVVYICLLLGIFTPGAAVAQQCHADAEVIVRMRKAEIGSYNVWDTVYGLRADVERFVGGTTSVAKNAVVAGERYFKADADVTLVMAELDRRGRVIWEKEHDIKNLRKLVKFLPDKSGYIVLANRKEGKGKDHIWIGFFDLNGGLVRSKTIRNDKFELFAQDMIPTHEGDGYLLAAAAQGRGYEAGGYAVLYKLDAKGGVIDDRAYMPGLENRILGLSKSEAPYYVATGFARSEDGRKTGWALKIDGKGAIVWQRQYPRGAAAQFDVSADYSDPYFLAAGESSPAGEGNNAAWVALLNGDNGDVVWQRYYSGEMEFRAADILTHEGGQISVLLDAQRPGGVDEKEFPEYARILTLSPRGVVLLSDTYYNGNGARAFDMFLGPNQERIMAGYSDVVYRDEDPVHPEKDVRESKSREAWVLAGAPVEPYDDPCVQ